MKYENIFIARSMGGLLLFLLFATNCWAQAFPATPVLDTFQRSNQSPPSSNWSSINAVGDPKNLAIVSNYCTSSGNNYGSSEWMPAAYPGIDFEVYATNHGYTSGDVFDVWALDTPLTGSFNGYVLTITTPNTWVLTYHAGVSSVQIGSNITQAFAAGDSFGMRKLGTVITVWYKPSAGSWTLIGTETDTHSYGPLYLGLEVSFTSVTMSGFGGGSIGASINNAVINNAVLH
jgi:hypothetical protein